MFAKLKQINIVRLLHLEGYEKQAIVVFALVILVIANFVISSVSMRADFSFGKAYTLSLATRKVLAHVDDIITIKLYVSDLPARYLPLKTDVTDLLNEYQKASSQLRVKMIDPKKDQDSLKASQLDGINELQISQLEKDKYAVSTAYFGIALAYGNKKEVIPQLANTGGLEYNLTAAIYKLTRKDAVKIGMVGLDDTNQIAKADGLRQVLQQQFTVDSVDVSTNSATRLSDYKTLLMFDNNSKSYDSGERSNLQKYLQNKGQAIFFVDSKWIQENFQVQDAQHNLNPLLSEYGIKLNNDLVLSANAELVNFGTGSAASFFTPYPFWLKTNNFDTSAPLFANINALTFPWVSSLTLVERGGYQPKPLIKTTPRSWVITQTFNLSPQSIAAPDPKDLKAVVVGAVSQNKQGGKMVVVPASRFVLDRYLSNQSANLEFVLNAVNDMASGGALSGIRQREVNYYPLPDLDDSAKDIFKYLTVLTLPVLLAAYGAWRLTRKDRRFIH